DVSATVDWDYAQVMDYANGSLANDRRHQIKAFGSYQLTNEFMLSGNLAILSGAPKTCLGYYGPDELNPGLAYNGGYYHFCKGKPYSPGTERQPWTYTLSLSAEYRPEWAGKKLAFNGSVFNVFDQQRITQTYALSGKSTSPNVNFGRPYSAQTPRYFRFGVSYDF
ncbi:MAG: Oar protein, partial [Rhodanobacter sp.]